MKGRPSICMTLSVAPPPDSLLHNCKFGFCAGYGDSVHGGCRDPGGYAASFVLLLNIRFSQDTAIRCMQGYDAAITFEVALVFTGSNADKEGASG